MDKKELVKDILEVSLKLQNFLEGFDVSSKSAIISSKFKTLFFIAQAEKCTPNTLIENLGLAKSNVAILCNQLLKEKLIEKIRDEFDNRGIFYSITQDGKNYLNEQLEKMTFNFSRQLDYKNNMKQIEKLVNELKKEVA